MLPLSEKDLHDLDTLRGSPTHRRALDRLSVTPPDASEAQMLHSVFVAGMKAIEEKVEEEGYAAMAAEYEAGRAERDRERGRRRSLWADDE